MATGDKVVTLDGLKAVYDSQDTDGIKQDVADLKSALETTYAKQDGYYQDMAVGAADQVISTKMTEDSMPYKFRTSGGSADIGNRAYMDKIVGGTVAFNQLVTNGNFANGVTGWSTPDQRLNYSVSNGVFKFTVTDNTISARPNIFQSCSVIAGHKYLLNANLRVTTSSTNAYPFSFLFGDQYKTVFNTTPKNAWTNAATVVNVNGPNYDFNCYFGQYVTYLNINDTVEYKNVNCFDLTQMFGSTVADYIYSLEQSTAGAGVAFFRSLFPDPYYEYNAGELISVSGLSSHDTVGFNAWDEEWEVGGIDPSTGEPSNFSTRIRSKNYIPLIGGATYYFNIVDKTISTLWLVTCYYDKDKNYIVGAWRTNAYNPFTVPNGARYMKFCMGDAYGSIYNNDICINLSHSGARNGEYESYKKHSYPLDSSLILRGVSKLDSSNNLYWDGDEYAPDGTVTRRYGVVTIDGTTRRVQLNGESDGNTLAYYAVTGRAFTENVITDKFVTVPGNSGHIATAYEVTIRLNGEGIEFKIPSSVAGTTLESLNSWFASNPTTVVYELATPTTETADAYQQIQNVDDYGTEEFVSTSIVPVGHVTRYPANLRDKLQHLPDFAASDGTYVILQSGSQMTLAPLTTPTELPAAPSANGTYTLKATVSNGAVTYSWGT